MVKSRPYVMDEFAKNDRPSEWNRLSDRLRLDGVPSRLYVVIVDDRVELAREPSADLALNRLKVFSCAGDLEPNSMGSIIPRFNQGRHRVNRQAPWPAMRTRFRKHVNPLMNELMTHLPRSPRPQSKQPFHPLTEAPSFSPWSGSRPTGGWPDA